MATWLARTSTSLSLTEPPSAKKYLPWSVLSVRYICWELLWPVSIAAFDNYFWVHWWQQIPFPIFPWKMPVQPVSKNHWSLHQLNSPDPTNCHCGQGAALLVATSSSFSISAVGAALTRLLCADWSWDQGGQNGVEWFQHIGCVEHAGCTNIPEGLAGLQLHEQPKLDHGAKVVYDAFCLCVLTLLVFSLHNSVFSLPACWLPRSCQPSLPSSHSPSDSVHLGVGRASMCLLC